DTLTTIADFERDERTANLLCGLYRWLETAERDPGELISPNAAEGGELDATLAEFCGGREDLTEADSADMREWLAQIRSWPDGLYAAERFVVKGVPVHSANALRVAVTSAKKHVIDFNDARADNNRRAAAGAAGLLGYIQSEKWKDDHEIETPLADLLGDLRHLSDARGADWDDLLRRGLANYTDESMGRA
ncbi:MAG: hypothetical protein WA988_07620, partial [Candidatus Nanopelagicales bacterium]